MACCALLLVPRVARAAGSGWNAETKTYTVNGTEGYRESVYASEVKLPDGAILNLSNAGNYTGGDNEPPALFLVQGDLTIIGPKDKELSFSTDLLDFSLNDWGTKTQLTLTVKDMRFQQTDDGNDQTIVLNQIGRKASDDVSIDVKYSGDCALPRIVISDKTELTFSRAEDASEASTLELYDVSNEGNGNVEPGDGGSLVFKDGSYVVSRLLSAKSIALEDCELTSGEGFEAIITDKLTGSIAIKDSVVDLESSSSWQEAVLGGDADPQFDASFTKDNHDRLFYNLLSNANAEAVTSRVSIEGSKVTISGSDSDRAGIGGVRDIIIDNSTIEVEMSADSEDTNSKSYSAGIGGVFQNIKITDSTVKSAGAKGAGIGIGHEGVGKGASDEQLKAISGSIHIEDSIVTATSLEGAGIGSAELFSSTDRVPQPLTITITGSSKVTARSYSAAGIGGGPDEITIVRPGGLEVSTGEIGGWKPATEESGEATQAFVAVPRARGSHRFRQRRARCTWERVRLGLAGA
ncbi:hypothetical protein NW198_02455 [Thermophilibacter sp. ET337]|uniref:hypothetical protein n=1 Tax=Thermophilibacter sp. ET337 TaxID=2973084 RepID=UPI0021ACF969|nr:hypothetical protein [Thermophilibacter sp. ET337]MCR8907484.1 hypothetical protein [Thermophilibacter sp. ET337]